MSSSASDSEIIADAGPIIALARLDLLHLPARLFRHVVVSNIVVGECVAGGKVSERQRVRRALESELVQSVRWSPPQEAATWNLDPGEASTISLALQRDAGVLVDDLAARRLARAASLPVIGTCGLLLLGKRHRHIESVMPLIQRLVDSGYYLGQPLIDTVRRLARET